MLYTGILQGSLVQEKFFWTIGNCLYSIAVISLKLFVWDSLNIIKDQSGKFVSRDRAIERAILML